MSKVKTSDILKVARTLIESKQEYYVCFAIEEASRRLGCVNAALQVTIRQKKSLEKKNS